MKEDEPEELGDNEARQRLHISLLEARQESRIAFFLVVIVLALLSIVMLTWLALVAWDFWKL